MWNLKDKINRRRFNGTARLRQPATPAEGWGWKLDLEQDQPRTSTVPPVHPEDMLNIKSRRDAIEVPGHGYVDTQATTVIPKVPPTPHGVWAVSRIERAYNDVAAKCEAAKALLSTDVATVLAGLTRYAEAHPVAA